MERFTTTAAIAAITLTGWAAPAGASTPLGTHERSGNVLVMQLHVKPVAYIETPTGFVATNDDFDTDGNQVGSDVTTCRAIPGPVDTARCDVGLALAGGLITITFVMSDASEQGRGRVTGGTGAYAGARGSVVIDEGEEEADVTISLRRR